MGTYTDDSQNRRTKKVAGTTTHYVYGLNGLLYGEYDNAGALIREYVYLNDAPLAQVDAGAPEVLTYLHTDHLGTPRFATNSGGTQVWAWSGDAFGVGAPSGSATINIRMLGQYVDAESGLFYNWNRYYNPAIGRYISSDPIGINGGLNTFLYANASPVMYSDPEGLLKRDENGNLIFEPVWPTVMNLAADEWGFYMQGYVFTDDGRKVLANKHIGQSENLDYNCHGMSFGDSEYYMDNGQVETILAGDSYKEVKAPQPGDIVVYRVDGKVKHTATVVGILNGTITVRGKGGITPNPQTTTVDEGWRGPKNITYYRK